jgi:cysteinyl-tRNA synthetase
MNNSPKGISIAIVIICLVVLGGCAKKSAPTSKKTKKSAVGNKGQQANRPSKPIDLLKNARFWAYQIQEQDQDGNLKKLAKSRYDMLVIDQTRSLKGEEDHNSRKDVASLKKSLNSRGGRKLVICYIDVGEAESYRWYWQKDWTIGSPDWIVAKDPGGWDENYPVKFWRLEWKDIVKKNIDRVIEDGYDGIYLDWLEVYSFEPVMSAADAEGLDPIAELKEFVGELRSYARDKKPDFIFIAQNAAELGTYPGYAESFDAVAQEAIWYDGAGDPDNGEQEGDEPGDPDESQELLYQLEDWQKLHKPVFDVEYAEEQANVKRAYKMGRENSLITYVTLRPLDRLTSTTPPGY